MPRRRRIVLPGVAHHVTQRGNNRQNVFLSDPDFSNYCYWINEYAREYRVDVLAYCLMNNHVHFIVLPQDSEGLARVFQTAHMRYSQYFNHARKMNGHLWQGRFFSSPLDDQHLFFAMRYVEQNPVRAQMAGAAWDYEWSSAKWHVGLTNQRYIAVKDNNLVDRKGWKRYLAQDDQIMNDLIRKNTQRGLASACQETIGNWEKKSGLILHKKLAGRPRREK